MSAHSHADQRSIAELRAMDEHEAKRELSMVEYQRWESLHEHLDAAEENRQELAEADAEVHSLIAKSDPSNLAVDVNVWGNDLSVYYGAEDDAIQAAAQRLADTFDIDPDGDLDAQAETLDSDDIAEDQLHEAKDALAELVLSAVISWNGARWDDVSEADREHIRTTITASRPDGWGVAGLIDAWVQIQTAVDEARNERLEVVRKFRPEERGGDR